MVALKQAMPIIIGYFSISVAFGVLATKCLGFTSVLMSAMVFAGASQFVALQMLLISAPAVIIVFMTFLINLRHILMSSYLCRFYKDQKITRRFLLAFGITDETFAISSRNLENIPDEYRFKYQITLNTSCYISWITGTLVGVCTGQVLPLTFIDTLSFILTALFLYLMVVNIKKKVDLVVALFAGLLSLAMSNVVGWNVLVATLLASYLGSKLEKRW
ncbi:MAG: branched-chain amino acid ABC transporter permease [Thaumarchaeota archaeon]|nr:MAG: branched-chain amino acid ABC transporter permease [Nitrososphaerota archaeon]